jgi:ribonuclease PH
VCIDKEERDESAGQRADGRHADELRSVELAPSWVSGPDGSVLIRQGRTWVLCTVTLEHRVPRWLRGRGKGWLTATYNMLPGSTNERTARERSGARGRTREIERMIGRALRGAVDQRAIGERTIHVDCDVLQADGGTRTAAVTGGWLALALACRDLSEAGGLDRDPVIRRLAAVSVGMVGGEALLDLDYSEDVRADTDLNVVMTDEGRFVELQGTAEGTPFSVSELDQMLALAGTGGRALLGMQSEVLDGG